MVRAADSNSAATYVLCFTSKEKTLIWIKSQGEIMPRPEITSQLAETELFTSLPKPALERLAAIVSIKRAPRGHCIFTEGDPAEGLYIVRQGQVRVYKVSPAGKEQTLHIFGPQQPVGEAAVFAGKPYPANAECLQDTELLYFRREDFVRIIHQYPEVALSMMAVMARRLMQFTHLVENLALKEAPTRLAAYILHLSERQGESDTVDIEFSKRALAGILGATPETLSRVLARLARENIAVSSTSRHITILDRRALERLSRGETQLL
jgi:CRP/FNR family transcriptional regulator